MRFAAALAATALLALPALARADGDGQPVATSSGQDDAFAQAQTPQPRPELPVRVTGKRPPSPPGSLLVASTAPVQAFDDDETARNIDLFINGPIPRPRPDEGEPPPCDETPHGEVGASIGGGTYGYGGGGYATVVKPVANCRGVVAISVAGSGFGGGRRGW
ncbi:MAG: hypothetical protein INR64_09670 [Caulobacteraceae bacterium]|nr:hypothetical protein [Caulobacter sp.]